MPNELLDFLFDAFLVDIYLDQCGPTNLASPSNAALSFGAKASSACADSTRTQHGLTFCI